MRAAAQLREDAQDRCDVIGANLDIFANCSGGGSSDLDDRSEDSNLSESQRSKKYINFSLNSKFRKCFIWPKVELRSVTKQLINATQCSSKFNLILYLIPH